MHGKASADKRGGVTRSRPRDGKCLFTAHELKSANSGDNSRIGLHALRTD